MEYFSLLRFWRASNAASLRPSPDSHTNDDFSGPFFDLEFAVPENDDRITEPNNVEDDRELKFAVSNPSLSLSPTDDISFKGYVAAADTAAIIDVAVACGDGGNPRQTVFPISLMRSATKLHVRMFQYCRPKSSAGDSEGVAIMTQLSKFFMNLKVEVVPIVSLFNRDGNGRAAKAPATSPLAVVATETRFSKEYVHKYLSRMKPLYVRVSKRYGEKVRFSGAVGRPEGETDGESEVVGGGGLKSLPAGLKLMNKRSVKSRSAPLTVTAAVVPPRRRDDSLVQLQDGIQGAIAHCKRSFNATGGTAETPLTRAMVDSGDGRSDKTVTGTIDSV